MLYRSAAGRLCPSVTGARRQIGCQALYDTSPFLNPCFLYFAPRHNSSRRTMPTLLRFRLSSLSPSSSRSYSSCSRLRRPALQTQPFTHRSPFARPQLLQAPPSLPYEVLDDAIAGNPAVQLRRYPPFVMAEIPVRPIPPLSPSPPPLSMPPPPFAGGRGCRPPLV